MNITNNYAVTIFRNDNEYGTFYKVGLSKKDKEGNYINGYKDVRFKKGVELADKTKIYIKKAWLDFYIKDKRTIDYIFISEFETLESKIEESKEVLESKVDPYEQFGNTITGEQMTITPDDLDLPF